MHGELRLFMEKEPDKIEVLVKCEVFLVNFHKNERPFAVGELSGFAQGDVHKANKLLLLASPAMLFFMFPELKFQQVFRHYGCSANLAVSNQRFY